MYIRGLHFLESDASKRVNPWTSFNPWGSYAGASDLTTTITSEDARADTWNAFTSPSIGVKIRITRTVWSTNDKKLYGFYYDVTYDSFGNLVNVSAETKVTLDTGQPC